jgi:hypothetical protein
MMKFIDSLAIDRIDVDKGYSPNNCGLFAFISIFYRYRAYTT